MVILAECACFSETNETYAWILKAMQEMEPRFKVCNITMMFSDEGVTVGLLQKLGIKDSCMLCADEWHMMNEVWPDKFGGYWQHVVNYLRTYIHHPDTVTCNESLQKALDNPGIRANPEMVEEIYRVHGAAKRYAGYTRAGRDGNLGVHGSTLAEVNHSSIVAHLGLGSCQRLEDQFQKLLERAQEFAKKVRERNDLFRLELDRFESQETTQVAREVDKFAKSYFAVLPYGWFRSETDSAKKLKCIPFNGGNIVCRKHLQIDPEDPMEVMNRCKEAVFIKKGDRCRCLERVRRLIQCSHDLALNGFVLHHWDKRWISDVYHQDVLGLP